MYFSFTVVHSAHPAVVRAEYGPFESSQMVPTQYLVPDLTEKKNTLEAQEKTLITDFEPHQLDLSAHLVTNEVREWAYFTMLVCYFELRRHRL